MDETIDLCDSDTDVKPRIKHEPGNQVEVITLDDKPSNLTTPSATGGRRGKGRKSNTRTPASTARKKPKLEIKQENKDEDDDEIQIIGESKVKVPKTPKGRRKVIATPKSAKRRKSKLQSSDSSPSIYRRISANSRISLENLMANSVSSGRRSMARTQKRKQFDKGSVTPKRTPAQKKKQAAVRRLVRQLQSPQWANKFTGKGVASSSKAIQKKQKNFVPLKMRVPLQNGKPKFRMEPPPEPPKPILREPTLRILRDRFGDSGTSRAFGTEFSGAANNGADPATVGGISWGFDAPSVPVTKQPIVSVADSTNNVEFAVPGPSSSSSSSSSSQAGLSRFGTNIYNADSTSGQARQRGSLRPIVIDGSNVAMAHGNGKDYSCQGIKVCSDYFRQRGHTVIAFVPRFRQKNAFSKDTHILEELEKEGIVKFTPSREVDGHRIVSYDDRFIVQYAAESGGIIVSNDNFRDIYEEQPLWRDAIRSRILQYTWVSPTCIMFPPDPLGNSGPPLDDFLRFD